MLAFAMASLVSTWFMALWPHPGKLMGTHFSKAWLFNGDPKFQQIPADSNSRSGSQTGDL